MPSSPRRSPRRKIHAASLHHDDAVSDMSSSFGGNNASRIFRPKAPLTFDEDESVLLHNAVGRVMDDAMGIRRAFDADTLEADLVWRSKHVASNDSLEGADFFQDGLPSIYHSTLSPASSPKHKTTASSDPGLVMMDQNDDDPSVADRSVRSKCGNFQRYLWLIILLSVVACTLGGIAGLITLLLKERNMGTAISEEQVNPSWTNPTRSPSAAPSSSPSPQPSLRPSPNPSTAPSVGPTPAPTTNFPTSFPSDHPTAATPSPIVMATPSPTFIPTTLEPTRILSLQEMILELSPETEEAWNDATSAQSLALADMGKNSLYLDKFALLTLAYSANVTTWNTSIALPCTWIGVTCDTEGSVTKVELRHRDLVGTLPPELALATNLEVISIAGSGGADVKSKITGSIPSLWGELLTSLRVLELYDNRLSGRIPESFWKLSNLEHFSLDGNQLTGIFPSSLGMMTSLKTFDLSSNNLVGTIPEKWSALSSLSRLSLKNNLMYGTLPAGLSSLSMLQELHLQGNSFMDSLPDDLRFLTNLGWLSLQDNQFTGTIPSVLGEMVQLEGIELRDNNFRGSLPASFGTLSLLRIIDLSSNFLTGEIPDEWDGLANLAALSLHDNQLHGQVSIAICESVMHVQSDCNANLDCSCCTDCFISS